MRQNKPKSIAIVTTHGPSIGNGHVQRMAGLASFIKEETDADVRIVAPVPPDLHELNDLFTEIMSPETDLVVRDMRDSTKDAILELRKIAPVCVIDDLGEGADFADRKIFLLPHPDTGLRHCLDPERFFLYGYNFSSSLQGVGSSVDKDIDLAVYCSEQDEDYFMSLVPDGATAAFLRGRDSFLVRDNMRTSLAEVPAGVVMLRSRVLISHFGISLYEGKLAGCRLFSLNPTAYHSRLSDIAADYLGLVNLGVRAETGPELVRDRLRETIREDFVKSVRPHEIVFSVKERRENFFKMIK